MKEKHNEMTEEQWRPIVDYEGIYEIGDLGNVKRVKAGKSTFDGKVLGVTSVVMVIRALTCGRTIKDINLRRIVL